MRCLKTRRVTNNLQIEINSLLDVLIILLVFLLKSYNPESIKNNLVKDLVPPAINISKIAKKEISIQVNYKREVFFGKEKIGFLGSRKIDEKLIARFKNSILKKKNDLKVNLYFDERISYGEIKDIMTVLKKNDVRKMKLILVGSF